MQANSSDKKIIYKNDFGGIDIVHPTPEAVAQFGIDAIAKKDVPEGKPYAIIAADDLPTDRMFREAWTVDDAILIDGVGEGK